MKVKELWRPRGRGERRGDQQPDHRVSVDSTASARLRLHFLYGPLKQGTPGRPILGT